MDPRVARTHEAVMEAARVLLLEGGPGALTVDGVVARSGVAKSTVYRHWATRDELVLDVLSSCAPNIEPPDEGASFDQALRRLVGQFVAAMADEAWNQVLPALLLLKTEVGGMADLEHKVFDEQSSAAAQVLRLGVDEGVLAPEVLDDVDRAVTLLAGPILMAGLSNLVALDEVLVEQVVHQFLAGQAA